MFEGNISNKKMSCFAILYFPNIHINFFENSYFEILNIFLFAILERL
jgi:hypothetical protein